jgi:tRNA threonylcarbamoyladenosine biosynthesis protein TsaE
MIVLAGPAETIAAGTAIGAVLKAGDIVALSGDLGAGKTCLARGILAELGLSEEAPSPSFALVIPYDPPLVRLPVWHVDLYRLDDDADVRELGLNDVLDDGALLIEWPERLGADSPSDALRISISILEGGGRGLTVGVPPSWEGRCPFQ